MFQVVIFEVLLKVEWIWEEEEGQLRGEEEEELEAFSAFLEPGRVHLSIFCVPGPPLGLIGEL